MTYRSSLKDDDDVIVQEVEASYSAAAPFFWARQGVVVAMAKMKVTAKRLHDDVVIQERFIWSWS